MTNEWKSILQKAGLRGGHSWGNAMNLWCWCFDKWKDDWSPCLMLAMWYFLQILILRKNQHTFLKNLVGLADRISILKQPHPPCFPLWVKFFFPFSDLSWSFASLSAPTSCLHGHIASFSALQCFCW